MITSHPSALPLATKLFLDALQAGGKLNSPTGPTVLAQAGVQIGVNPQMEPPPEEQQGIAAILNQAQQAGPTIANNQAAAQQQQLVDQAANKAAPAAAQMLQPQTQQPQGMATGGLAALPAHIKEFKEGGVIGYEGTAGSYVNTQSPTGMMEQEPEVATSAAKQLLEAIFPPDPDASRRNEIANRLRSGLGPMQPGIFESLTPTERASRLNQESQMRGMIKALSASQPPSSSINLTPDHAMATEAMGHPVGAAAASTAPSAKPAPKTAAPAAPSATSTKVSASTREKIVSPTAPEKSGIAADTPSVQKFDNSEAQRLYALRAQQVANKPDFQSMGLADIAAMQKRNEDSSSFRRFAAIAGARRPGINAGSSMMAAAGQFAETQDALANEADKAKTSLAKATYSESIGDTDAMLKHQEDFNKHKEEMIKLDAQMKLGIYQQQQMNKRNEEVNAVRAQMAELRAMTALSGRTGNLKDPAYVYNVVSDNVTKQMENVKNYPSMAMKIKTPADLAAFRDSLYVAEVQNMIAQNANVPPSLMKYVEGKTEAPATGKLDFANIGK